MDNWIYEPGDTVRCKYVSGPHGRVVIDNSGDYVVVRWRDGDKTTMHRSELEPYGYDCPICNPGAPATAHTFKNFCRYHTTERAEHLSWEVNFQPNFEELERLTRQYKTGMITGHELVQRTSEWVTRNSGH